MLQVFIDNCYCLLTKGAIFKHGIPLVCLALACSKRSDSGERFEVKKAMKSRGGLGREVREPSLSHLSPSLAFIFSRSFLLRIAPHYLNAWNRLVLLASADFLVKVQEKVEKEEQDIKDHLNSLYSKYGKLKDMGRGAKEILTRKRSQCLQCSGKKPSKTFNIYMMQRTNVRICFVDTF